MAIETRRIYGKDVIEIPRDKGHGFLEIVRILSEEGYSGPFDGGQKESYRFDPVDRKYNMIMVNLVKGVMNFIYISPDGRDKSHKRVSRIKNTLENQFKDLIEI